MTGAPDREAAAVARQHVAWALAQGLSLHDLFAAIHLVPRWDSTPADAIAHYAGTWIELTDLSHLPKKQRRLQQLWRECNPISPIVFAVCEEFKLLPQDIFSESRIHKVVEARREIVARARTLTRFSCQEIAQWVGLDRTTVLRHLQTAERRGRVKAIRRALRQIDQDQIDGEPAERLWLLARAVGRTAGRRQHARHRAAQWRLEWRLKGV